ncbi:MAG: hypothetical protein H7210_10135 [Pyrinomonadaceae bacterium]|nr:hypothetical protein [Phycisphaerales bacterium]
MTRTCSCRLLGLALVLPGVLAGCTHTIKVEPIKVEPIDITLHIYLEADQKLDEFFSDTPAPAKPPAESPRSLAEPDHAKGTLS